MPNSNHLSNSPKLTIASASDECSVHFDIKRNSPVFSFKQEDPVDTNISEPEHDFLDCFESDSNKYFLISPYKNENIPKSPLHNDDFSSIPFNLTDTSTADIPSSIKKFIIQIHQFTATKFYLLEHFAIKI